MTDPAIPNLPKGIPSLGTAHRGSRGCTRAAGTLPRSSPVCMQLLHQEIWSRSNRVWRPAAHPARLRIPGCRCLLLGVKQHAPPVWPFPAACNPSLPVLYLPTRMCSCSSCGMATCTGRLTWHAEVACVTAAGVRAALVHAVEQVLLALLQLLARAQALQLLEQPRMEPELDRRIGRHLALGNNGGQGLRRGTLERPSDTRGHCHCWRRL